MRRTLLGVAAAAVIGGAGCLLAGCSSDSGSPSAGQTGSVSAGQTGSAASQQAAATFDDVLAHVAAGAKLYDVREPNEYSSGHFERAENYPVGQLTANKMPSVAKDTRIYVYCRTGVRSGQAAAALKQAGFTDVVDLHGLADIQKMGGKLVTS